MENKLIILGCGGHARSVADVFLDTYPEGYVWFVDGNARDGEEILGFPVLKSVEVSSAKKIVAIGNNHVRCEMSKAIKSCEITSVISNNAYIGREAKVGVGCLVAHMAHIGVLAKVGDFCIINTGAKIDHEAEIGECTHVASGATVCGRCKIGRNVFLGAGSVVKDSISITDGVIVGSGAVVVKDITEVGIYVGCPARKIK